MCTLYHILPLFSYGLDFLFLKRFANIVRILFPGVLSKISALFLLLLVVAAGGKFK